VDACVTKDNLAPGGGLRASGSTPTGVVDRVGNVSEWEDSCATGGAPQDKTCATRGGSISDNAATATCSFIATAKRKDVRSTLGFRCCSR
jgi:formylglycine-generating enzyme required for sulfatase activity